MMRDMSYLLALQYVYPLYVSGNWPATFLWWNLNGFMLWALFVIGERTEGDESATYIIFKMGCTGS